MVEVQAEEQLRVSKAPHRGGRGGRGGELAFMSFLQVKAGVKC